MQPITISVIDGRQKATEHYSFWLTENTMQYIRNANNVSRISQGQILQLMIDYFRLTRKKAAKIKLTELEAERLEAVKNISRILPI